jgi:hypothetical protein
MGSVLGSSKTEMIVNGSVLEPGDGKVAEKTEKLVDGFASLEEGQIHAVGAAWNWRIEIFALAKIDIAIKVFGLFDKDGEVAVAAITGDVVGLGRGRKGGNEKQDSGDADHCVLQGYATIPPCQ